MKYKEDQIEVLVSFLKETKDGKYAKIEESSLECNRLDEQPEYMETSEKEYYYSIS